MNDILARLDPAALWEVLSNPTRNLTGATLLLAMAILIVIIVLTAVTALLETGGATRRTAAEVAEIAEKRRARRRESGPVRLAIAVGVVLVALVVLTAAGTVALTRDSLCVRCHQKAVADEGGERTGAHPAVRCARCHAEPGASGRVELAGLTARSYSRSVLGPGGDKGDAPSSACLGCHADIAGEPRTVARVRVSHREFIGAAGFRCVDCHAATGHGAAGREGDAPRMSLCVLCHDGETAKAECGVCHVGDITGSRDVSIKDYPLVTLGPVRTCRGCHSVDSCTKCHGLELPHTEEFMTKGEVHGPKAAFGRRALCERCHAPAECATRCHPSGKHPADSHTKDWRTKHGEDASADRQSWCRGCHVKADFGCRMCHPRYGPPPKSRGFR